MNEDLKIFGFEKYEFTEKELKKQYRELAKKYHPDHVKDESNEDLMQKINAAYEKLLPYAKKEKTKKSKKSKKNNETEKKIEEITKEVDINYTLEQLYNEEEIEVFEGIKIKLTNELLKKRYTTVIDGNKKISFIFYFKEKKGLVRRSEYGEYDLEMTIPLDFRKIMKQEKIIVPFFKKRCSISIKENFNLDPMFVKGYGLKYIDENNEEKRGNLHFHFRIKPISDPNEEEQKFLDKISKKIIMATPTEIKKYKI